MTKSKALTTTRPAAIRPGSLSREQISLIKRTFCRGASDDEFSLYIEVCNRRGLDPFTSQIHSVKRYDRETRRQQITYQIGIDGFRAIAVRTGEMDGMEAPQWCGPDGVWREVWAGDDPPHACKVIVYRKGHRIGYPAIAYYQFHVQTRRDGKPNQMWAKGAAHMLAKCAEAAGLRKAFPDDLGGLYTHDEVGHVEDAEVIDDNALSPSAQGFVDDANLTDSLLELRSLWKRADYALTGDERALVLSVIKTRSDDIKNPPPKIDDDDPMMTMPSWEAEVDTTEIDNGAQQGRHGVARSALLPGGGEDG